MLRRSSGGPPAAPVAAVRGGAAAATRGGGGSGAATEGYRCPGAPLPPARRRPAAPGSQDAAADATCPPHPAPRTTPLFAARPPRARRTFRHRGTARLAHLQASVRPAFSSGTPTSRSRSPSSRRSASISRSRTSILTASGSSCRFGTPRGRSASAPSRRHTSVAPRASCSSMTSRTADRSTPCRTG